MKVYILYKVEGGLPFPTFSVNSLHTTREGAEKRRDELNAINTDPMDMDGFSGCVYDVGTDTQEIEE